MRSGGLPVRQRYIHTKFWYDKKVRQCVWLEKLILLHLQLRDEMTTVGAITTDVPSICTLLNAEKGRNFLTPELPRITEKHITRCLKSIRKKGIVETQNRAGVTIYFFNFLRYNSWSPSVYNSFPTVVRDKIPEGPIQEVVRQNTIGWMEENNIMVPQEWQ